VKLRQLAQPMIYQNFPVVREPNPFNDDRLVNGQGNIMDKKGKDTGFGKIELDLGDLSSVSPLPLIAIDLFNYNIDGNLLKDEHKKYLDCKFIPMLKKEDAHVKLSGTASKSGPADYNRQLSLERVLRVKKYLIDHGVPESKVPGPDVSAAGKDLSTSFSNDDERDRAVRITLRLGTKPRPIPLPRPRRVFFPIEPGDIFIPPGQPPLRLPPVLRPRKYRIQYVSGIGVSAGGSLTIDVFRIIDVQTNESATFNLVGAGVGLKGPSVTLPAENDLVEFECMNQSLGAFHNEPAGFATVGVGPTSLNTISFPMLGVAKVIPTGFNLGLGANVATGIMKQTSRPRPNVPGGLTPET